MCGLIWGAGANHRGLRVCGPARGLHLFGPVAGAVFARLDLPQRCIVMCPNHTGMGQSACHYEQRRVGNTARPGAHRFRLSEA